MLDIPNRISDMSIIMMLEFIIKDLREFLRKVRIQGII